MAKCYCPLHYPLISEWIVYNKSPSKKVVKLTHQQSQTQTYKYTMEKPERNKGRRSAGETESEKRRQFSSVENSVGYGGFSMTNTKSNRASDIGAHGTWKNHRK